MNTNPTATAEDLNLDPPNIKLKVCGMKYPENMLDLAKMQPDYMGLIFYKKSSRYFTGPLPELPKTIQKVGVFVNASAEKIIESIKTYQLHAIQLHGEETPEFLQQLIGNITDACANSVAIIKAYSIGEDFDFSVLQAYEDCCDFYLFDTKGKLPGGNGHSFNWNLLNNYPSTKPYFLSGGIGLEEAELLKAFLETEAATYCYAIDVNSQFEIEAGLKNLEQLIEFKKKLIGSI